MRDNTRAHDALDGYIHFDYERYLAVAVLEARGLLLAEPTVIHSAAEIRGLDPDAILMNAEGAAATAGALLCMDPAEQKTFIEDVPAVIITGDQAREIRQWTRGE